MESARYRRFGYAGGPEMAWVVAHQGMLVSCVALAPAIGNIPAQGAAGLLAALALFLPFSEGVRRTAWRRRVFPGDPQPPLGSAACGALAASVPAMLVAGAAWAAYGFMSWRAAGQAGLGLAYIMGAITAAEAVVARIGQWRPWMFNALCLALQPMFLFGPLFRPDKAPAPKLYALSLWNPVVPAIETARAGLLGAPAPAPHAFYAWLAAFAVTVLWCGGTGRLRRDRDGS